MAEIKERDLDLGKHEVGYQWEAGETPPGDSALGRWLVRLIEKGYLVLFKSLVGTEYEIHSFPATPDGERAAKEMAAKIVDIAWGRYRD